MSGGNNNNINNIDNKECTYLNQVSLGFVEETVVESRVENILVDNCAMGSNNNKNTNKHNSHTSHNNSIINSR